MSLVESGEGGNGSGRKPRAKPTLVKVGNKFVISSGQYHIPTVANYVLPRSLPGKFHPKGRWMSVGEMAALRGAGADPTAKKKARRMLPRLAAYLLDECSRVLIYDYEGPRIARIKVYDPDTASDDERREARDKLEQMKNRADLSADRYEKASALVNDEDLPEQGSGGVSEVVV